MDRARRRLASRLGGLAVAAVLAGCTPIVGEDLGDGEYAVTTRIRLQGSGEASEDNAWLARQTCPNGFIVLDDQVGRDENGAYRRWVYGCLETGSGHGPVFAR